MSCIDPLDNTLLALMEDSKLNLKEAAHMAHALELPSLESICTTRIRDLDADQIRTLAVTLKRSANELLGL